MAAPRLSEQQRTQLHRWAEMGFTNAQVRRRMHASCFPEISKPSVTYYLKRAQAQQEEPPAPPAALAAREKPTTPLARRRSVDPPAHNDVQPEPAPAPQEEPQRRTITVEWKPRPDPLPVPSYVRGRGARSCSVVGGNAGSERITQVGEAMLGIARSIRGG